MQISRLTGIVAACGLALAGTASAQNTYTFELVSTPEIENIEALSTIDSAVFIGNNPSSIAFDGRSLYVGGFNNSSSASSFEIQVAQIVDFLDGPGVRQFLPVAGSSSPGNVTVPSRGYSGLSWDDNRGLLATVDGGNSAVVDQIRIFNTALPTAGNPTPVNLDLKAASFEYRGIAGPSWDYGADGDGYDYDGDGAIDGPVAAILDPFFDADPLVKEGPFGLIPPAEPGPGGSFNDLTDLLYERGDVPIALFEVSTFYRDIDIDPDDGGIAVRTANGLIVVERDGTTVPWGTVAEDPAQLYAPDNAPFVSGQNVHWLTDLDSELPDAVIWNDRDNTGTQSFASTVKITERDGTAANLEIVDSNGDPVLLPDGVGYYDFEWHEPSQTLLVMDFTNRAVFVLREPSDDACPADLAAPFGVLDFFDVLTYLGNFDAQDPSADLAAPAGTFDFFDVLAYLGLFDEGCD
ncbi:MAG: GC-type dockerin domain-anchored protein [Planctomycetota bacterium]